MLVGERPHDVQVRTPTAHPIAHDRNAMQWDTAGAIAPPEVGMGQRAEHALHLGRDGGA